MIFLSGHNSAAETFPVSQSTSQQFSPTETTLESWEEYACLQTLVSHAAKSRGTGQTGEMSAETVIAMRSEGEMNHGHQLKELQEGFNKKGQSWIHLLHSACYYTCYSKGSKRHKLTKGKNCWWYKDVQRGTLMQSIPWLVIQNTQIQQTPWHFC